MGRELPRPMLSSTYWYTAQEVACGGVDSCMSSCVVHKTQLDWAQALAETVAQTIYSDRRTAGFTGLFSRLRHGIPSCDTHLEPASTSPPARRSHPTL